MFGSILSRMTSSSSSSCLKMMKGSHNRTIFMHTLFQDHEECMQEMNEQVVKGHDKALKLKSFHEKKSEKRKRKVGESAIRLQNRKIGDMLKFIRYVQL